MVLLGMMNVALKWLGGSLIWKDYCFFQFPEENGLIAFKLLSREAHQQINKCVLLIDACNFFSLFLKKDLGIKTRNDDQFCLK